MSIFVSGGAGFIGSHLVEKLSVNNQVIVFDNLLRGSKLKLNKNITVINKNIKSYNDVKEAMNNCNTVFHLAAFLGVDEVAKNPIETMETESIGTFNIINSCIYHKIKKIVYASTSGIYGKVDIEQFERAKA